MYVKKSCKASSWFIEICEDSVIQCMEFVAFQIIKIWIINVPQTWWFKLVTVSLVVSIEIFSFSRPRLSHPQHKYVEINTRSQISNGRSLSFDIRAIFGKGGRVGDENETRWCLVVGNKIVHPLSVSDGEYIAAGRKFVWVSSGAQPNRMWRTAGNIAHSYLSMNLVSVGWHTLCLYEKTIKSEYLTVPKYASRLDVILACECSSRVILAPHHLSRRKNIFLSLFIMFGEKDAAGPAVGFAVDKFRTNLRFRFVIITHSGGRGHGWY